MAALRNLIGSAEGQCGEGNMGIYCPLHIYKITVIGIVYTFLGDSTFNKLLLPSYGDDVQQTVAAFLWRWRSTNCCCLLVEMSVHPDMYEVGLLWRYPYYVSWRGICIGSMNQRVQQHNTADITNVLSRHFSCNNKWWSCKFVLLKNNTLLNLLERTYILVWRYCTWVLICCLALV